RMHISAIRKAGYSENATVKKSVEALKSESDKKCRKHPPLSSLKKQLNKPSNSTQSIESFLSEKTDLCGGDKRSFVSSSSDDENSDDCTSYDERIGNSTQTVRSYDQNIDIDFHAVKYYNKTEEDGNVNEADLAIANDSKRTRLCKRTRLSKKNTNSMRSFIATWNKACQEHTVPEVFKRMLEFYDKKAPGKRKEKRIKQIESMFSSFPCAGLLNVAISSIKSGMWDIIYDTREAASEKELTNIFIEKSSEHEITDVDPSVKDAPVIAENEVELIHSVSVQDIIRKVATYFDLNDVNSYGMPLLERRIILLRKLYNCDVYENSPLEVCMLQNQLVVLVAQALNGLWGDKQVTKQMISSLLMRQFPLIGFKISEKGSVADFLDIVGKRESNVISKAVLFSVTLFGMSHDGDLLAHHENDLLETTEVKIDISQNAGALNSVTSKDAIELLCRAPLLSDLNLWTHWDMIFAPSLGPLVTWLLNEVNMQKLLCLVTKEGKVIRLDHSATVDSFLEAALERSPLQTAVQLLSLFSLFGGEKYVPMSLLKCHTRHAFEVIMKNLLENMEVNEAQNSLMQGFTRRRMVVKTATSNLSNELLINFEKMNKAVPVISRFVLDCLGYLPPEFRGFAADILLLGMRSLIKDAASAVLSECNQTEQRLMLHEVGLSLGIVEWIDDYHAFCSTDASDLYPHETLCLNVVVPEKSLSSKTTQDVLDKPSTSEVNTNVSAVVDGHKEQCTGVCQSVAGLEVFDGIGHGPTQRLSELDEHKNASLVIESIRQDEFGLDPSLSSIESSMLKKQHARLGRALHCLSHELYSQDSHFLLELVQNADDNIYPEDVEPTLTFILQESGIILLNNEQGFSAQNIRALCDVGNSTKKGSNAGYIGQKGIGFKSVFRVTDAPEIHSNGFHVKFDISEGQIGFVLPTLVPPCNIDLYSRLASGDTSDLDAKQWNTCIVLPFRTRLSDGTVMTSIMTMFSDLHPSLLLFLHRLKCIKFRNLLNNSLIVMRKEIMGDGIVRVSHGKEKMTWLLASQKLRADVIRPDVCTTEISVAFTLQESIDGDCVPILEQQPVFAFLPLRTYGLKFILQGDFVLPSSREEVDGDSSWNQWLSSEFPGLFVGAERSFCSLLCFRENPGKAVSAFMSFVPLVGEVHGFFSSLPRLIISKLRMSNCLLLEGGNDRWVPPCKVLRGWDEQARILLPDGLLSELLGLGFLDINIKMSDSLARALGIQDYGPTILLQFISSLSQVENGIKSMSLSWLSSWISSFYIMLFRSGQILLNSDTGMDLIENLKRIKFIPLSDGTFSSVNEGTIWLPSDTGFDGPHRLEAFQSLFAKLRTVSPALLSASTCDTSFMDVNLVDNITKMFHRIGVKQLSAHEILKAHILTAVSNDRITNKDKHLMIEYICFAMIHLQSSCPDCCVERVNIISELRNKAFILTNYGFKRPVEVSIHFSKEYGNPVNANKLTHVVDMKWHEVDATYLRHPVTESTSCGLMKWREFFQEIGILDFVKIFQVNKTVADISPTIFKNVMWERDVVSPESIVNDWESHELVHLMSLLLKNGTPQCCIYLLEVLDTLWDSHFSESVTGYWIPKSGGDCKPFKSSFLSSICDVQWVVSSIDDELHYPKDLFYDCDTVRSILGASAPYAVPKRESI
ncbi:hypothetical protein F2P56_015064, partial [Juglans regia]